MSHVWKHFTKTIDKNKSNTVKCNYCGNQYSRGGNNSRNFNTSNLTKHLKRCSKYNTETSAAIKKTLNSAQTSQSQTLHSKFDAHNAELEEVNPHDADDAQMEDGPTTNLFVPEEIEIFDSTRNVRKCCNSNKLIPRRGLGTTIRIPHTFPRKKPMEDKSTGEGVEGQQQQQSQEESWDKDD
ncbi:hypothetical protein MTP99_005377 [Tenebrio molitor]|nr:hypothetical protein MTP99_005377 [Tenebrio molitor]